MVDHVLKDFNDALSSAFDLRLDELLEVEMHFRDVGKASGGAVKEYQTVSPQAKHKLKGILQHYAKEPHPFQACVDDNTKRFGLNGAQRVCAVLKDIIRGTTKWRGKNNPRDAGVSPAVAGLAEPHPGGFDDPEVVELIDRLDEMNLWELMGLAGLEQETAEMADTMQTKPAHKLGIHERLKLARQGKALPDGSFPIRNHTDLKDAIQSFPRSKDKRATKNHIVKRAKKLNAPTDLVQSAQNLGQSSNY